MPITKMNINMEMSVCLSLFCFTDCIKDELNLMIMFSRASVDSRKSHMIADTLLFTSNVMKSA